MGRWLTNRRVGTRLLAATALVAIAALVVGLVSLSVMQSLQTQRQREVGRAVPYITGLQQAALAAKSAATDERGFFITGDQKYVDESLGRRDGFDTAMATSRAAADTAAERATVDEIQASVEVWFQALRAEYTLAATDRDAAVTASFGVNRDARKAYEAALSKETERASTALAGGQDFAATVRHGQLVVLMLLLISLALAVGAALVVRRSIVSPLTRVTDVLTRVADGDLGATVGLCSRDEIGTMAQALDHSTLRFRAAMQQITASAGQLAAYAGRLTRVSTQLSTGAGRPAEQSQVVSAATEEISANIATVAAAGDEMSAAIREIAASTAEASSVAAAAVTSAGEASATLSGCRPLPERSATSSS